MSVTIQQKEALLQFMEAHRDFGQGRVSAQNARVTVERLKKKLSDILNSIPGATKSPAEWLKGSMEWSKIRSDAKQEACSNGRPKSRRTGGGAGSSDEDEGEPDEQPFTTDNPFVNRVMTITGWEVALGVGVKDELSDSDEDDDSQMQEKIAPFFIDEPEGQSPQSSLTTQPAWTELATVLSANVRARNDCNFMHAMVAMQYYMKMI